MNLKFINHINIRKNIFYIALLIIIISLPLMAKLSYPIYVEIGRLVISQDRKGDFLNEHVGFFNNKLSLGMSKSEVENILWKPDNYNSQNVWIWLNDLAKYKKYNSDMNWEKMIYLHGGPGGIFLVFVDNKLETKLMNTAAFVHPVYVLAGLKRISFENAVKILHMDNENFADYRRVPASARSGKQQIWWQD